MKNFFLMAVVTIFGMLVISGCVYAARYDGPYHGKVIDADTGEPIEGVVILGVWKTAQFSPAGATHNFYDARETVTDKNGDFSIPGMGLRVLSNLEPMDVTIFKAGYELLAGSWIGLKEDILLRKIIKWEGSKAIIPLKKLTVEERKKRLISTPNIPDEKMKMLTREMNEEYMKIKGFSPYKEVK